MEFSVFQRYKQQCRDVDAALGRPFLNRGKHPKAQRRGLGVVRPGSQRPDYPCRTVPSGPGAGTISVQTPGRYCGAPVPAWSQSNGELPPPPHENFFTNEDGYDRIIFGITKIVIKNCWGKTFNSVHNLMDITLMFNSNNNQARSFSIGLIKSN
ncbi:MAG: hypothetical protein QXT73_08230 [Candidatus Methanomethylicaceae archaeon]